MTSKKSPFISISVLFVLAALFVLTSCSSNSENKDLVKKACSSLSDTYLKENHRDNYADIALRNEYSTSAKLFRQLSVNEARKGKDFDRIFKGYAKNIESWAKGVNYFYAGLENVTFFCGPNYKFTTRKYPDIVSIKHYVEDYLGIPKSKQESTEENNFHQESFNWQPIIAVGIIILYIFAVYWIARTAKKAGRSFIGWFVLGLFITPIAGIIVLTFKPESEKKSESLGLISNQSMVAQLEQLEKLHAQGIIDADEFKKAKGKLLN